MTIIVEDGTIVANANSYVSVDDYLAHALARDIDIDAYDAGIQLIKAAEFIDAHEGRLKGNRSTRDQSMAFPRSGVITDSWEWGSDEIPRQVLLCQLAVALQINAGEDPYNPEQSAPIIKERVEGAVEVAYASPTSFKLSKDSNSQALLNALLRSASLTLVRV